MSTAAASAARFRFRLYFLYGELFLKAGFIVQTYLTGPFDSDDITRTRINCLCKDKLCRIEF